MSEPTQVERHRGHCMVVGHSVSACQQSFTGNPCQRESSKIFFLLLRIKNKTISVTELAMDTVSKETRLCGKFSDNMCKINVNYNQMTCVGLK